ncbi:MAG: ferrochelatase [Magnetococcales bacterium]|nr:ferrochelatase [Magnetococcales bacterium]
MSNHKIGVLLLQMGTPDAPTKGAVRSYLEEFLSDKRVVDTPRWLWLPILHGIILRSRPGKSAALYKKIWREDNNLSPLLHYTQEQKSGIEKILGHDSQVRFAMRYGNPSIEATLDEMLATGLEKLLVYPLYPQFSASTTGSGIDAVHNYFALKRSIPTIRFARPFYGNQLYIKALAKQITKQQKPGNKPFYLFTFHGLPQRHITEGDPYQTHCETTAQNLAKVLNIPSKRWRLTYQSRFGREQWLLPATGDTLAKLPAEGEKRLVVICPGFVSDCLETLEEIAIAGKKTFLDAGGEQFQAIPCLNDSPAWIAALSKMVKAELVGWC